MRTTMAEPRSARGDIEPADAERARERRNPRKRSDHHDNRETTIDVERRLLLIRGSSRGHVVEETTPTRDHVRL
jgi:hypothetical protein